MPSWYDDPNSNTPEQWQPEYMNGAGLSEGFRRYMQGVGKTLSNTGLTKNYWEPDEQGGYRFAYKPQTPEEVMNTVGLFNVMGPVRTTGQSPYKMIEYWSKGKPEPPIGHGTSRAEYTEPMTNPMGQTKPARFDYLEIGPSNINANREIFEELERNLGTKELDRMELTEMLPGAVPYWERWGKSQHTAHLPTLRKQINEMAEQARAVFGSQIPERGYGYARKRGELPSPQAPHFGKAQEDPMLQSWINRLLASE